MCSDRFGFDHAAIERGVAAEADLYPGLATEALYTSSEDLERIFSHPLVKGTLTDLGCGTGQAVLHYAQRFPDRKALGLERARSRVQAGIEKARELSLPNVDLREADLLTATLPSADVYFLYFPTGHVLDRVLSELSRMPKEFLLVVIESHGDLLWRLDQEPWCERVAEVPLTSPRHYPNAVFYRALPERAVPAHRPFAYSFLQRYFAVADGTGRWIGESFGLEVLDENRLTLRTPPRTIDWASVEQVLTRDDFGPLLQFVIDLRGHGELELRTPEKIHRTFIRKIFAEGTFSVEIASGETIEWSHISTILKGSFLCYDSSSSVFSLPPVAPP